MEKSQKGLEVIRIKLENINPYKYNTKTHTPEQIEYIKESITKHGFNDPIAVWGENNIIVEGHGRYEALKQLGYREAECIRLDHLDDKGRREYSILHNQLTLQTGIDEKMLKHELENIEIDMGIFEVIQETDDTAETKESIYTEKTDIPQYQITGETVSLEACIDTNKYTELVAEIEQSNVNEKEKQFLKEAATRHYGFIYKKVAEYYAQASAEMQELMEKSALVIIDYQDAIKNGYVKLTKSLMEMIEDAG